MSETESLIRRQSLVYGNDAALEKAKETLDIERWHFLTAPLLHQIFEDPSFIRTRKIMLDILYEMWNEPSQATSLPYPHGYGGTDILVTIMALQTWGTNLGLISGEEVNTIKDGHCRVENINPTPKYLTRTDLYRRTRELQEQGKVIGLVHGAFDPQHVGHAELFDYTWHRCDVLLVGFDPNWVIRQRKGPDRPRFPQLAWRMWEVASLPHVDHVFVLPLNHADDEDFYNLYRDLGIKVLGTSEDNAYLDLYRDRMASLGGQVVIDKRLWSSTHMLENLSDMSPRRRKLMNLEIYNEQAISLDLYARYNGFLRDYPNGTFNTPNF